MAITLSWDLFVIAFSAIVISYGFIIGKHESVKIILSAYIAVVAVQGIGNVLERLLGEPSPLFRILGIPVDVSLFSMLKLVTFTALMIFLAVRSGLSVSYESESGTLVNVLLTALVGFATAGLLVVIVLTFVAGTPLLDPALSATPSLAPILAQSKLMQLMALNQDLWFSLPALLLIGIGFINNRI
ncbi:MAG: hypothetical protein Q7R81_00435 [Candidatus Peregrinibacteria bacterium]|nr:hypothetical protein [Candidatus Peregrinibacteria bacterium]